MLQVFLQNQGPDWLMIASVLQPSHRFTGDSSIALVTGDQIHKLSRVRIQIRDAKQRTNFDKDVFYQISKLFS